MTTHLGVIDANEARERFGKSTTVLAEKWHKVKKRTGLDRYRTSCGQLIQQSGKDKGLERRGEAVGCYPCSVVAE